MKFLKVGQKGFTITSLLHDWLENPPNEERKKTPYEQLLLNVFIEYSRRAEYRGESEKWEFRIGKLNDFQYMIILFRNEERVYQKIGLVRNRLESNVINSLCKLLYFDITTFGLSSIKSYDNNNR